MFDEECGYSPETNNDLYGSFIDKYKGLLEVFKIGYTNPKWIEKRDRGS